MQSEVLNSLLTAHSSAAGGLTGRELAVLQLLADGMHNKQIATRLGISARTVERHCDSIYGKLGVRSRTEAVVRAISTNLVEVSHERG